MNITLAPYKINETQKEHSNGYLIDDTLSFGDKSPSSVALKLETMAAIIYVSAKDLAHGSLKVL